MDTFITGAFDPDDVAFARAARARLLAEAAGQGINSGPAQAAAKVARFYQALGLTPASLNAAVSAESNDPRPRYQREAAPLAVYALRELADMVYRGNYRDYASLPGVAVVDFTPDGPAALKMRLAPLPQPQRMDTMLGELSHKDKLLKEDNFEIQLAADEGLSASHAVAARLRYMQAHREQFAGIGFAALFDVLRGVGDKEQAPLVAQFQHDSDYDVGYYSRMDFYKLQRGMQRQYVAGY